MRGITGIRAGRGSHDGIVAVAGGRDDGIDVAVAADGAGMCGVTVVRAGRSRHNGFIGVVRLCQSNVIAVTAVRAGEGLDALCRAGRHTGDLPDIVMAGGRNDGIDVAVAADGAGMRGVTGGGAGRVDNGRLLQRMLALALSQLLPDKDGIAAVDLLHAGAVSLEGSAELRDEAGGFHGLRRHLYKDGRIMHRGIDHHAEAFEAAGAVVDVFHFKVAALGVVRVHDADGSAGVTGCL